jgi:hypothetical protein
MKKIIVTLCIGLIAFAASSCTRDYTCSCVSNVGGINSTATVRANNAISAANKCNSLTQGGTSTCTLQ